MVDREKTFEDDEIINMETYHTYIWQRRLMIFATGCTIVGVGVFIAALLHSEWTILDFVNTDLEHVNVRLGVWGEWRTVNTTRKTEWIPHFPAPPHNRLVRLADEDLKNYYRVQAAFGVLSLAFMICTNCLAIWTFSHHRYMYKRLVGSLFGVTAGCVVICMEVLTSSINEWNVAVTQKVRLHPEWSFNTDDQLGLGYYLAGSVVVIYFFAAIVFFICSHKQKGSRAATTELEFEDRPVHFSRN